MRRDTATARALKRSLAQVEAGGDPHADAPILDDVVYVGTMDTGHLTCRVDGFRRTLCMDRDGHRVPAWAMIDGLIRPCGNCVKFADARRLDVPRIYLFHVLGRRYGLEVLR